MANQISEKIPTPERRVIFRQRVLKKGLIVFNNGHASIGCQLLDVSERGAKLLPADVLSCPREFVLKVQAGQPRQCEIMWRKGSVLGVCFRDSHQSPECSEERRQEELRRRASQRAVIVFNRGLSTMASEIIDISDAGAKLIPADVFGCPREFVLKPNNSGPRQCTVLWRRGVTIGVRFL